MDGRRLVTVRRGGIARHQARRVRQSARNAAQTVTLTHVGTERQEPNTEQVTAPPPPTLRLHLTRRRRVRWTNDTHDNEHENKRSSKSCCIFHKKRAWDESSTESEDDMKGDDSGNPGDGDDNDSDVGNDDGRGLHGNDSSASSRTRSHPHLFHGDGHNSNAAESDSSSSSGGPTRSRKRRNIPASCNEEDDSGQPSTITREL